VKEVRYNKIFVGGLPRSGTTMVQNILDSHPLIYGGSEFDRLPNIIDLRAKLINTLKSGRIEEYTNQATIDEAIRDLIETLFKGIKSDKNYSYISEKTPWNILFFEELFELYPKAKFIMVLRHPFAVLSSMKKVAKNAKEKGVQAPDFTKNYLIASAYMEQVYAQMQKMKTKYPDSFYIVRYESLLKNLEQETKLLCDFIGVNWSADMLGFNTISHPGEKTMTKNEIWYTKEKFKANPNTKLRQEHIVNLTFKEKAFLNYLFFKNSLTGNYFNSLPIIYHLIGKLIYQKYKSNYQFKTLPKRLLN